MSILTSINPFTGALIGSYKSLTDAEALNKAELAEAAFTKWRHSAFTERSERLKKLADVLVLHKTKLATLATSEMGKPIAQAVAEVEKCALLCHYYAEHGAGFLKSEKVFSEADTFITYEPLGVILGIMPWNFPYWQVLRFAVPTLMSGNTVLVKHASNVQGCAAEIENCLAEAGLPKGCYANLCINSKQVESIIRIPAVKAVSLTGSEQAGSAVARVAGEVIKKSLLELGGSNAFIVLADADLNKTLPLAITARMQNNGQSCIASKRFIVEASVAGEFTARFCEMIAALTIGNPMDESTNIGPLARADLAAELHRQVMESERMGAKILCGGKMQDAFYYPTLLAEVRPGMPVFDEETFGPVAALTVAIDADEAIELANTTLFGLGATICSSNIDKAKMLGKRINDGAVFINEMVKSDPRLPFGGTGISGFGRELGMQGIREFVNVKTWYCKP